MSVPQHSQAFRVRRFWNWFPMGLTYALLYMARYNLTVAKTSLGERITKEDFGYIFGAGTLVYAISFLVNGPLVDRLGGRRGILAAAFGSATANLAIGFFVYNMALGHTPHVTFWLSVLYAINMYFQSFGAVSIVKVNAHWFHVGERGGFSGIFGTMISSGIFLAFTVNGWLLDGANALWPGQGNQWSVFVGPALLLLIFGMAETFLLRDKPSESGHADFDTGDASSGESDEPVPTRVLLKRILTNPVILTVAGIEFCTGVLRNGVMHWFPIYAKEVWILPKDHVLMMGAWTNMPLLAACFAIGIATALIASRARGKVKGWLVIVASLTVLVPFFQGGWGGLLFIAGVVGGNLAGWLSDLLFQSRRGPVAGGLYALLGVLAVGMWLALAPPTNVVAVADPKSGLQAGDEVLEIAGKPVKGWADVTPAVACVPPVCQDSVWNAETCACTGEKPTGKVVATVTTIPARIHRDGVDQAIALRDPLPIQRAGDKRLLKDQPVLPLSALWLGLMAFLVSLSVIGVHGVLSGTATMDFGGKQGAGTAVGVIDGFVYLGTALQSVALGWLTTRSWSYWPLFLFPFGVIGFLLCLRIWHAKPSGHRGH